MGLTKHLFCRIGWMENYQGQDDGEELIGGGAFVDETGTGSEIHNFSAKEIWGEDLGDFVNNDERNQYISMYFGFVMYHGQINICKLGAGPKDKYIDGITVFWVAPNPYDGKDRLIGWYKNARVYRYHSDVEIEYPTKDECCCNIFARSKDGVLLPVEERRMIIHRASRYSSGIGQSNVWYAQEPINESIVKSAFNIMKRHEGLMA